MAKWYDNEGFQLNINRVTDRWIDAMKSNGAQYVNWQSAWRNGMRNADKWAKEKGEIKERPKPANQPVDTETDEERFYRLTGVKV